MTVLPPVLLDRPGPSNVCRRVSGRPASAPSGTRPRREGLELFAIWSYVVFSFAALFFALYVIWAKCQGNWPF